MKKLTMIILAVVMSISTTLFAQRTSDVDGAKDYPMISRFDGSFIEYYKVVMMGDYKIPIDFKTKKFTFQSPAEIKGKLFRIQYSVSSENNPEYIVGKLKSSLEANKFEIVYAADNKAMLITPKAFNQLFYDDLGNGKLGFAYGTTGTDQGLIVAKTKSEGKDIYTVIYISWFDNATLITEDVIEATSFKQNVQKLEAINLITPFKGATLGYYKHFKWDTYIMPISKMAKENGSNVWAKRLKIKGEISRIQYITDKDNNAAFVYQNYLDALKKANWEVLFSGSGESELGNESYEWQYSMFQEGLGYGSKFGDEYGFRGGNYAYIAAKFEEGGYSYYVDLYIIEQDEHTLISEDVIKEKNPDVGLVTAQQLDEKIAKKGHLALDGVYFESGSAVIMDKSETALQNTADYLNKNKSKRFFIVGHTDYTGDFDANRKLSEARAQAVMNALINRFGVDPNQLKAFGIANLSPVLSNSSDEGRAKNRRVEIVEQLGSAK